MKTPGPETRSAAIVALLNVEFPGRRWTLIVDVDDDCRELPELYSNTGSPRTRLYRAAKSHAENDRAVFEEMLETLMAEPPTGAGRAR